MTEHIPEMGEEVEMNAGPVAYAAPAMDHSGQQDKLTQSTPPSPAPGQSTRILQRSASFAGAERSPQSNRDLRATPEIPIRPPVAELQRHLDDQHVAGSEVQHRPGTQFGSAIDVQYRPRLDNFQVARPTVVFQDRPTLVVKDHAGETGISVAAIMERIEQRSAAAAAGGDQSPIANRSVMIGVHDPVHIRDGHQEPVPVQYQLIRDRNQEPVPVQYQFGSRSPMQIIRGRFITEDPGLIRAAIRVPQSPPVAIREVMRAPDPVRIRAMIRPSEGVQIRGAIGAANPVEIRGVEIRGVMGAADPVHIRAMMRPPEAVQIRGVIRTLDPVQIGNQGQVSAWRQNSVQIRAGLELQDLQIQERNLRAALGTSEHLQARTGGAEIHKWVEMGTTAVGIKGRVEPRPGFAGAEITLPQEESINLTRPACDESERTGKKIKIASQVKV